MALLSEAGKQVPSPRMAYPEQSQSEAKEALGEDDRSLNLERAEIALRAYVVPEKSKQVKHFEKNEPQPNRSIVCAIDTETTVDQYQNLLFGSFGVWIGGRLHRLITFYSEKLSRKELNILKHYRKSAVVDSIKVELARALLTIVGECVTMKNAFLFCSVSGSPAAFLISCIRKY